MIRKRFNIQNMHCVGCTMTVEGAIEDLPGVKSASANYAKQFADVEYEETQVAEADIIAAVQEVGYAASPA